MAGRIVTHTIANHSGLKLKSHRDSSSLRLVGMTDKYLR
jgi:hypothetical protein